MNLSGRKVKILKNNQWEGGKQVFVDWGLRFLGGSSYTVAIIMDDDGVIELVPAELVRFTPPPSEATADIEEDDKEEEEDEGWTLVIDVNVRAGDFILDRRENKCEFWIVVGMPESDKYLGSLGESQARMITHAAGKRLIVRWSGQEKDQLFGEDGDEIMNVRIIWPEQSQG